jgi:hypothetical protein
VAVEDPKVRDMSASAGGTREEPGRRVAARRGPNRAIPDQGRGMSVPMPGWKPAGRGGRLVKAPPRHAGQTCPARGRADAGNRPSQAVSRRVGCGLGGRADHAGALNVLRPGRPSSPAGEGRPGPPAGASGERLRGQGSRSQPSGTRVARPCIRRESPSFRAGRMSNVRPEADWPMSLASSVICPRHLTLTRLRRGNALKASRARRIGVRADPAHPARGSRPQGGPADGALPS